MRNHPLRGDSDALWTPEATAERTPPPTEATTEPPADHRRTGPGWPPSRTSWTAPHGGSGNGWPRTSRTPSNSGSAAGPGERRSHFHNGTNSGSTTGGTAEPPEEPDAGWRAAVDAAVARANAAEGEADRLRHELETLRATVDRALFRAEDADRGRYEAEARLEAVRTAAWSWVATVRGLAWWRRLRRLPDPPPALVAGERLLAKPED